MKLLYHHRTASRDGQEVHVRELIAALRGLGHEVAVVAPGGEADEGEGMGGGRGGVSVLRRLIPDAMMPLAARAYEEVFTRRLVRAGRALAPQAIYERHALDNRVGARAAAALGIPLLVEVNAPLAREQHEQGALKSLEPALRREIDVLRRADAVLAVTGVLERILVGDGVPADRVHVVHNGVSRSQLEAPRDRSLRGELGLGERDLVLGFIGFPRTWHRLDRVIAALARGRGGLASAVLLIAGEGPIVPDLLRDAQRLGVADRVRCIGVLDRAAVIPFLDALDVALQPAATRYASPLKLFEYLARGLPTLAPRQPNIEEIVVDGESARLFAPDDDEEFEMALAALASDAALRARLGRGARERIVAGGFTWERNATRVVAIAQRCAEEKR
jgi:glycosyltransferase involved in cell wall biosynthesis